MLRFSRTRIITFDMEEALAFTGETGPYLQNAVVRARNIFGKLAAEGHERDALVARARSLDHGAFLTGEEGDLAWSLLLLMARSEEVAEQAIAAEDVALVAKHAFAVAQAFHSYYQKPQHSLLHAASEDLRASRALVVDAFVRQMEVLLGPARDPDPGADVRRAVIGITLGDGDRPGYHLDARRLRPLGGALGRRAAGAADAGGRSRGRRSSTASTASLLSGGVDVDPALYGRPRHPKLGRVDRERDDFELALTREALRRDLPILAICRGQQVLNVATGGTLIQDIPSELEGAVTHAAPGRRTRRSHPVEVTRRLEAREILGSGPLSVNSFHHQAIDRLGEGLTVSGRCPEDGVIEAVEMKDRVLRAGRAVAPGVVLEGGGVLPGALRRACRRLSRQLTGEVAVARWPPRSPSRCCWRPPRASRRRRRSWRSSGRRSSTRRSRRPGAPASRWSWTSGPSGAAGATVSTEPPTPTPR